jgi:O-antigen/teichoic acid export membrane protein
MGELIKSILFNTLGSFLIKVSTLLLGVYVARTSGLEEYALYSVSISAIVLLASTLSNVFSPVVSAASKNEYSNIYLYSWLYIVGYITVVALLNRVFGFNLYVNLIIVFLIYSPALGLLNAMGESKIYGLVSIFIFIAFGTFLIVLGYSAINAELALELIFYPFLMIGIILNLIVISKIEFQLCFSTAMGFKVFSKKITQFYIGAALVPLVYYVIYNFLPTVTLDEVGLFASAMTWNVIISQVSVVVSNVLVSRIKEGEAIFLYINNFISIVPALVFCGFIITFPEIHSYVFGNEFSLEKIRSVLVIVMLTTIFNSFKSSVYRKQLAAGKSNVSIISNLVWGVIIMLFILFFDWELSMSALVSVIIAFLVMYPIFQKSKLIKNKDVFNRNNLALLVSVCVLLFIGLSDLGYALRLTVYLLVNVVFITYIYKNFMRCCDA